MKHILHLNRNGQPLGTFDLDKIMDHLAMGRLLPTDIFYHEESNTWQPLSLFLDQAAAQAQPAPGPPPVAYTAYPPVESAAAPASTLPEKKTRPPEPEEEDDDDGEEEYNTKSRGRGKNRSRSLVPPPSRRPASSRKNAAPPIGGWIASIFMCALAAGIWAWGQNLNEQLKSTAIETTRLRQAITDLKAEKAALSDIVPPGHVRCLVTYSPSDSQVAILSGVTVSLYPEEEITRALLKSDAVKIAPTDFGKAVNDFKAALPNPATFTLSDSDGRANLTPPVPGNYVIFASGTTRTPDGGSEPFMWLIKVRSGNDPSLAILLAQDNATSSNKPEIRVQEVKSLAVPTIAP